MMRVRELLPLSTCAVCRQRSTQGLLDCQASLGCSILSRSSLRIWDAVLFGFRKLPCKLFWAFCKRPLRTGSSRCQECQRRLHLQLERSTTRRHELALSDRKQTKPRCFGCSGPNRARAAAINKAFSRYAVTIGRPRTPPSIIRIR